MERAMLRFYGFGGWRAMEQVMLRFLADALTLMR